VDPKTELRTSNGAIPSVNIAAASASISGVFSGVVESYSYWSWKWLWSMYRGSSGESDELELDEFDHWVVSKSVTVTRLKL
jgi:hypothetical protein